MTILHWLDQIQTHHRPFVGDKALMLGQLQQQGYPVFSGFVLNTRTFRSMLEAVNSSYSLLADFPSSSLHLDVDNPQSLQLVAQQSRRAILETPLSPQWREQLESAIAQIEATTLIIRPSLSLSLPETKDLSGILLSQLAVNQLDGLELGIKKAWSSLFSAKSLFFFEKNGIKLEKLPVALLIQPIYDAIASGIGYLTNKTLTLQATWGLGYSLLQGEVNPDYYQLDLEQKEVKFKQLGQKPCAYSLQYPTASNFDCLDYHIINQEEQEDWVLTPYILEQFLELGEQLQSYPGPKQIEWTIPQIEAENNKIYLTQLSLLPDGEIEQRLPQISLYSEPPPTEISGIAASPGIAIAPLHLMTEQTLNCPANTILVAQTLPSQWLPCLKTAKGLILEESGITSHGAILARELGIPAIVGVSQGIKALKSGDKMVIDGNQGKIYHPSDQDSFSLTSSPISFDQDALKIPLATRLMVNLSQRELLDSVSDLPTDGIGLIRSELMLLELLQEKSLEDWLQPSQKDIFGERLKEMIGQFAQFFQPKPVFYRVKPDYLDNSPFFNLELQALYYWQQQGYDNLNLILPFVRHESDIRWSQQQIQKIGLDRCDRFQLWIMAEVPSVLFLLENYVKLGIKGIAIGSNDLAQFLLGIDRESPHQNYQQLFNHPALLKSLEHLIKQSKQLGIGCSLCGQLPVNAPHLIENLIRWGLDSISVEPASIKQTYQAIAQAEKRILLAQVRNNQILEEENTNPENKHEN
ncbi:MAG: putative PEP-binding protein [Microcystaceae cyanobacterium]